MTPNQHYLNCQDENCERLTCVSRRDYEGKIKSLERKVKQLANELFEAKKYDNCICKGQRKCPYHAMLES